MSISSLHKVDGAPQPTRDDDLHSSAAARPAPRAAWAMLGVPLVLAVWSVHAIWQAYSPAPFADAWANVQAWRDTPPGGWLAYLFSQHNEHRILFPRLIFLADWQWLQARNILNLVAIGLIQLAGAAFFFAAARPRRLTGMGMLGLAVAVSLMVSLVQWENLFWAFQVAFVAVYAAAAWALYLFCKASDPAGELHWGVLAGAMAMLAVATFSMANGVFAGAVMVFVGLVTRRRLAATAVAGLVTAALLAVYLHGYVAPVQHAPPSLALHHPGRFVTYIAAYLGGMWFAGDLPRAALTGLAGGLATLAMFLVVIRKDGRDPARTALFAVVLFVGISAASTSLGRLNFGIGQALSSRYMTPTAYFWAAHALFWPLTAARWAEPWFSLQRSPSTWTLTLRRAPATWGRVALLLTLGFVLLRLVFLQSFGDAQLKAVRERVLVGSSALLGGIDDQDALLGIHPVPALVKDLAPFMRATRISIFADPPAAQVGARFQRQIMVPGACRGYFDWLTPAPGGSKSWRASGWGWDLNSGRSFSRVVIVDDAGLVLGVGLGGLPRKDVEKAVSQVTSEMSGWVAALDRGAGREAVAYGITPAGQACELGRKAFAP